MGGAKERGCREDGERERVCSHSEREKRYKGREGNLREADAELKAGGEAGFGQRFQATGIGEEPMIIAFSLREGGVERLMTTALTMREKKNVKALQFADTLGQRRPSTYCAHEFSCCGKTKTGNQRP